MSRLYWSNLPDAKRPRGGTSTLWSSLTTEDLPIPEYPETSTNSGLPLSTTRSKEASKISISCCSPVQFLGNQEPVWRVVFAQREFVDVALSFPFSKATPKITFSAGCCLVAFLSSLRQQLHDDAQRQGPQHSLTALRTVALQCGSEPTPSDRKR